MRRLAAVLSVLLADARSHRLQTATTLAGVAVGIAVVVAIRLASSAALDQFRGTYEGLTGAATHELTGVEPLPAARLMSLRAEPSVRAVQPVVAITLVVPPADGGPAARSAVVVEGEAGAPTSLRLVGVDPFQCAPFLQLSAAQEQQGELFGRLLTEPRVVLVGPRTARQLGLPDGGELVVQLPGRRESIALAVLDEPRLDQATPPVALTDLASAQELLSLGANVLRFDLLLDGDGSDMALQPGEHLAPTSARGERADSLTDAFATNLMCLGLLGVLVGAFLVFSMGQFAVVRRRALLGRLRCLGCTASHLLAALLGEAALTGLLGGALGLLGGALLARGLVGDVARSVGTLYGPVGGLPIPQLDGTTAALGLGLAVFTSVAASLPPARAAAATPPVEVAGQTLTEGVPDKRLPLLLVGLAALLLLPTRSAVLLPSLAVLGVLLATATALPRLLDALVRRVQRPALLALACGQIARSIGRAGSAAGALAMPLAMTIAVIVMVGSFRLEVMGWSTAVLGADVYVKPLWFELAPDTARLPDGLVEAAQATPGVRAVDRLRAVELPAGDSSFVVAGAHLDTVRQRQSLRLLNGASLDDALAALDAGQVLVSEPLARRRELSVGDSLVLEARNGPSPLRVAAVFQDFSLDRGYALLEERMFIELFGPVPVRNAALLLEPDASADAIAQSLAARFPEAEFRTVERLRSDVAQAFDDTFAITWVLQTISTALALVGVLTALLCLHIERRQELGVLRALGARHTTVGCLLLLEALLITGVAGAVAVPVGLVLAWILVHVIQARSFGWSFPMVLDGPALLGVLLLSLLAGVLAALIPWALVARERVATLVEPRR